MKQCHTLKITLKNFMKYTAYKLSIVYKVHNILVRQLHHYGLIINTQVD